VKLLGSGCWIKVQEVKESFSLHERYPYKRDIFHKRDLKNLSRDLLRKIQSFLEFIIDNLHCHKNHYESSEDINRTARKRMEEISARERFHFDSSRHWDFLDELWSCRPRRLDFIFGKPPAVCKTPVRAILRSYADYRKNVRGHLYGARRGAVRSNVRVAALGQI